MHTGGGKTFPLLDAKNFKSEVKNMVTISKFSRDNKRFLNLLARKGGIPSSVETTVRQILTEVKMRGDAALHAYMQKFDQVDIGRVGLFVSEKEFTAAKEEVSPEFKQAIKRACDNLFTFLSLF